MGPFGSDVWWQHLKEHQPPIDGPLFAQIAGLARVPTHGLARLQAGLALDLEREWGWHHRPSITEDDRRARRMGRAQVAKLKRLSSELCAELQRLNFYALQALCHAGCRIYLNHHSKLPLFLPPGGPDFDQIQKAIATLAERASKAADANRPKASLHPVGRRARGGFGPPGPGSLKEFTLRLLWDVRDAGGRLTLDKNSGNGTLPATLKLLSPHLPPGFVPKVLPFSTLASVHALDKKLAFGRIDELYC
jgi:hypothetical protein